MTYLRNCWYAAGFSDDFGRTPISRTLFDTPMALYRTEAGEPVALRDRCPHRFAPLSMGKVFGDALRCPYHGLRFGPDGRCVENPIGEGVVPKTARVSSYPLHEVDGIVWIWWGEEAPAPDQIVRFEVFNQPDNWATNQGYISVAAAYNLVSDNLLDLSHAEFLHPDLATEGFNKRVQLSVSRDGDVVTANNWRPSEPITRAFRAAMEPNPPEFVDHRSIVRWHPPATLYLDIGVTPVGRPDREAIKSIAAHAVTPETASRCHYFFKAARNHHIGDEAFSERQHRVVMKAFETEDKPMIEAQQRSMDGHAFEDLRPVMLASDGGAALARRILNKKLADQTAG